MNHKPFVTTELNPLPNAVQELIAERDEWKARCEFSFEQRDKLNAQLETLQYEVDAIPAIKAERDDFSARYETASRLVTSLSDALAKALKERDALKAELARPESTTVSLLRAENAALKDAARLALDVCIEMRRYGNQRSVAMAIGAEAALKAVL